MLFVNLNYFGELFKSLPRKHRLVTQDNPQSLLFILYII